MKKVTDLFSRITEALCVTTPFAAKVAKGVVMGLMIATSGTACGTNVTIKKLWNDYSAAEKKDLPKTAIAILHRIQAKAGQQKSYGDLLYAMIEEYNKQGDISPDSAKAAKDRLLARQKEWRNTNGVLATICQTTLHEEQGAPRIDSLLASKDAPVYLKKNGTTAYKPLIRQGIDSRYFADNILSLIALHTGQQRALYNHYASTGERRAACIAAALWMERKGTLQQLDSLTNIYQDLPECGALAVRRLRKMHDMDAGKQIEWIDEALRRWPDWKENNELRNTRNRLTNPQISFKVNRQTVTTDRDVMLYLSNVRNVKGVKVTLRRINKSAKTGYDLLREYEKAIPLNNEHEEVEDSGHLGRLPLGTWEITVTDTEGKVKAEKNTLYVSDLMPVCLPMKNDSAYVAVVNAITGHPVPGATIHLLSNRKNLTEKVVRTDSTGGTILSMNKWYNRMYATHGDDTAMRPQYVYGYYAYNKAEEVRKRCNIYTDRAIYRPGQTVKVALTHYAVSQGKEVNAVSGDTVEVTLFDALYKEVEKKRVVTDAFGAASAEFQLPSGGRNGAWSIVTKYGTERIRVEEYKRPTFDVTLEKPDVAYHNGDTVTVKGTARTYSGMPVANAKVAYTVRRNLQWWWHSYEDVAGQLQNDTVVTAADGTFCIKMPMIMPENGDWIMPRFYRIDATASVTDNAGETHIATMSLPLSNREAYLSCVMPDEILADSAIMVTVSRRNAAGTKIEGSVRMLLDGVEQPVAEANKPYILGQNIQSGEHTLMAICGEDTVKNTFVAFRKSDVRPMKYTRQWCYQSAKAFPEDGGEVWIQIGSSDEDVHVFYTVYADDRIIKCGSKRISNENITQTLSYKEEYGDGLTIALAWVKDGTLYSRNIALYRPLPEKKLNMEWETFRDRLVPGQKERWAVRITNQDGTPAKARMMAVLYDKSLDQLSEHTWEFADSRSLSLPYTRWTAPNAGYVRGYMYSYVKDLDIKGLGFTTFVNGVQRLLRNYGVYDCVERVSFPTRGGKAMRLGSMSMAKKEVLREVAMGAQKAAVGALDVAGNDAEDEVLRAKEDGPQDEVDEEIIPLRSDFAETAFFLPAVLTDEKGVATMAFTLPESVTTWCFMALAHDDVMRNATLVADAVAQKKLMVQPNMPRFLRCGDNAVVAATVANLADKAQNVKVTLTVLDAETEKKIVVSTQKVTVKNGETGVVTFPLAADKMQEGAYIFRFTAQGAGHTDGEQRSLTVLSDEELITSTVAYTFTEPLDTVLSFSDMMPDTVRKAHLRMEYVDNPAWLMMETLPEMASPKSRNAISLVTALYANRVAASLKWMENKSDSILNALRQLQNSDGSFSWWQGMEGSVYMTSAVVKTLARLNRLCGRQADTRQLLDNAFRFMLQEMDKDVRRMRQQEKKHGVTITQTHLDWLYSLTLEGRNGGASAGYLLSHVVEETRKSDMMTKAVAAIVLHNNGRKSAARTFAEAIKQHTVYRKDVGRYFDSYRAPYSWCDYRIPTQTLAIEALREIMPQDRQTIAGMRRWLLNSKRTQEWGNPYNTVNAVHAFLGGDVSILTKEKGRQTLADKEVTPKSATVTLRKQSDCESWAAAYVTFRQKASAVKATATGLSVQREVLVNGVNATADNVRVGDKVTVRITVTADRDYDFVSVTDKHPACLEPVAALSGYHGGCYQEVKDTETAFHFCRMAKGTHVIQTEYHADRAGDYRSGTVTAECAYANEFRGVAPSYDIKIKK